MSQSANVRSVQSIHDFKLALATFAEDARNALSGVESDLRRTRNWLQRDQLSHWQAQVKRRNEEVSMARTELHRRRLSQQGSDAISDTEQKENLRIAQRRLEEAEHKLALVKKWGPVLEHAIAEYHSASQPLGDRLTGALVASMALLDRTVASIEAYLATAPPITPLAFDPTAGPAGPVAAGSSASQSGETGPKPDAETAAAEEATKAAATDDHATHAAEVPEGAARP